MKKGRFIKWVFLTLIAVFSIPIISKSLPIVRDNECYRSFFPSKKFLSKLSQPVPFWMNDQIQTDFQSFSSGIRVEAIDKTYRQIQQKFPNLFYRYRIIDNQLYAYQPFSMSDTPFEKALKTLLLNIDIPNVDFIYCPMDGLPEAYMPQDFYLTENPNDQAPILAKAKIESAPYIVLIPDQFSLSKEWFDVSSEVIALNEQVQWEEKKEAAFWRGGFTDTGIPNGSFVPNFKHFPRFKISKLSGELPHVVDAGIPWSACDELDAALQKEQVLKTGASKEEHLLYKYLPVLDGHMCTYPGYQWRLLSNSVSFKQSSEQVQWFYRALQPYVHYIPVKNDMSDLVDQVEWAKTHDLEVKQIVRNAQEFASNHLMIEDDYLYLYLVLKQYASQQRIDWERLKKGKQDPNWKCIQYRKRQSLAKSWHRCMKSWEIIN